MQTVRTGTCVRQGIDRLTLIFSQLVIASLAVSTITTLEVAVKWPESVAYVSILFFLMAVVRCVLCCSALPLEVTVCTVKRVCTWACWCRVMEVWMRSQVGGNVVGAEGACDQARRHRGYPGSIPRLQRESHGRHVRAASALVGPLRSQHLAGPPHPIRARRCGGRVRCEALHALPLAVQSVVAQLFPLCLLPAAFL